MSFSDIVFSPCAEKCVDFLYIYGMNYYCISHQVDRSYKDHVLLHPAYYSDKEFKALVKEALAFIHGKMLDSKGKKSSRELTWQLIGFLIANYNFEYLDTEAMETKITFIGDYTKDDIEAVLNPKCYTAEELYDYLGRPKGYTSELLEQLNKEIEDDYKRKID